jgi:hypothetical protein
MRIVVVDPSETQEHALLRSGLGLGPRGPITFIHTGVPRSLGRCDGDQLERWDEWQPRVRSYG